MGQPNVIYSCDDVPGTQDLILTPADIDVVNGMLVQMVMHSPAGDCARLRTCWTLGALCQASGSEAGEVQRCLAARVVAPVWRLHVARRPASERHR